MRKVNKLGGCVGGCVRVVACVNGDIMGVCMGVAPFSRLVVLLSMWEKLVSDVAV